MRRMIQSASVVVLSVIPAMLTLPDAVAGQECAWSASAGLSIPATRDLRVDGVNADLTRGWIGRLGRTCGSGTRRYGLDADAQHVYGFGGMYLFSLMGRLGRVFRDGSDPRIPWLEVAGNAGFVYAFDPGDYVEILIPERPEDTPGRQIDLPGLGLTVGGSARAGFPVSPYGSFLLEIGIRASLLPTKELNGLLEDTPNVLVTLPITLGYQLSL